MARIRSVDFLPEIFQTPVNKQFLAATLDQLVQEPKFEKTQGFVGRRVGPGVNPRDRYVVEPTKNRNDYQLEPGVVSLKADVDQIADVITYPGINDALALQGADVGNAQRLYTSEYYSWDPFVDFDKMVNFSQYYWLPFGPDDVDVSATDVPLTDNFIVDRNNGVYTFSGVRGTNPVLTLVRGGNYTFQVAQNDKETVNFRVTNDTTSAYVIDYQPNPVLTLTRGNTYVFNLSTNGIFPFYIKTEATLGTTNTYNNGVSRNGAVDGTITFVVPQDAPDVLYYVSSLQINMRGQINIVDAQTGTGPGFWIQATPGVNGRLTDTLNISSRDVLGVSNNGEDLGTVQFNVPLSTAQDFFYNLTQISSVSLVSDLLISQVDNQPVADFIATHGGIDGISDLDNRTVIFPNETTTIFQIRYVLVGGIPTIQLTNPLLVNTFEKFSILFGTVYSSTQWYNTAQEELQQIPLLTAALDTVWYQDGTDPEIFGRIQLIDQDQNAVIDVDDIVDAQQYTSPNGVAFTNGLKVTFRGTVIPLEYQDNTYYVEGVGTAIKLLPVNNFVTPETYTQSFSIPYDTTPYDVGGYDDTLNAPVEQEYLTINRASADLNPWTRANRWFHIDVITATAEYNNTTANPENIARARRPILEYRAGTRLFNFGTQGKQPVDVIDFTVTDAFSDINGTTGIATSADLIVGYSYRILELGNTDWNLVAGTTEIDYAVGQVVAVVAQQAGTGIGQFVIDGYALEPGSLIIFAADQDPAVRNKIYQVEYIVPDTVPPLIVQPIINLIPAPDGTALFDQSVVCLTGATLQGITFYFDGLDWIRSQQKTATIQAPLFDIYDLDGVSFSNLDKYPSSTFVGTKLFSYATGTGVADSVLGFPLRYLTLANVGDIVFDNNLYKDTFVYVENSVGKTVPISNGLVHQYSDRVNFTKEIGWQAAVTASQVRQQFQFTYDGSPLRLDIRVANNPLIPAVQLYVGSQFQDPSNYTVTTTTNTTTITLNTVYSPGAVIEVSVLSNQISRQGFYQVPINLENNPLNENSEILTLGTVRSHYGTIAENLINLQGPVNGANNTRDLGNLVPYGLQILQQSSPLTLTGYFLRNPEYDIFGALEYNSREYIKFKSQLLETVVRNEYGNMTVAEILDSAVTEITRGRTDINPFYWSDMLPAGSVYTDLVTTVTPITTAVFGTTQTYDFESANYFGLLVYLNQTLLIKGTDYTVATDGPRLTITRSLAVGDVVTIREYSSTYGNFVPNTPTKMGLYPKYRPEIFFDTGYINPTAVIQGHDGSITVAFGDVRDQVLLEFEKRIFNNIKTDNNPIPLTFEDVAPGFFRTTQYSQSEITDILGQSFLNWVGGNKIDYKTQNYIASNPFTYNYSSAGNKLNEQPLPGAWRGIYRYFYDTESPSTRPWEMLGFSEEPVWWTNRYGPAPYTSDNLVLWDDLEAGYVADPIEPYIRPEYARPGLTQVIPSGTEGQLLAPIDTVVGAYDPSAFQKSWVVGDGGPAESAWWTSSSYPFAVMRLLSLTRPAEFFSLFADRDLYRYNDDLEQYVYNGRYRLDANGIEVYGNGVSKASYVNWIVDYNQQLGRNSSDRLTADLKRLDVRLCYRMASFTDKQYLKIFSERSSPDSQNSSLLLPDESYNLLLYKNQPFSEIVYSALIVERTADGYAVYGYSTTKNYFEIFASSSSGILTTVSAGGATVRVPTQYTNNIVQIPYGYVFTNTTVVVDFILSYGAYLQSQGLIFEDVENGYTLNWNQMAQEFLYFSQQGWAVGTMINLNPAATRLQAFREGAVVDTIVSVTPENLLLDQNRSVLPTRDLVVDRLDNNFSITSTTGQTISYLQLRFTSLENMVVLDNVSVFNDLIYDPITAARQNRLNIVASTTTDWNGQLDAQGFILNQDNVQEWQANRKYTKGEIVLYKGTYWSAQAIVQPRVEFNYNDWVKSDYSISQEGLLPNIANKADQLTNSYNINTANLERDNDLLSYGLIGFRPRQYMQALNLDDVSQVNIYQQFLGNKGTTRSAEIFTRADLGKESAEYNIFENWGILVSTYGANANRSFFELRLNEALLPADPATIQVIEPGQFSDADQTILLQNIWRTSYPLTSPDILPTTYNTESDTALPSAGYVNLDDADISVFSLDDPSAISQNIENVGIGTIIWVAKSNSYDWNIYRCERVPGQLRQVSNNLNGTSVAVFTTAHDLAVGDLIVIRYFETSVNGVYRVLNVPGINSVVIEFDFENANQNAITGDGLVFYLQSARVRQASDVASLPYVNLLTGGAKAWVDNNGRGHWQVLEKQTPFVNNVEQVNQPVTTNEYYGTSITQTVNNLAALVGAPGAVSGAGAVIAYYKGSNDNYTYNVGITLDATGTVGFGNAVEFGNQTWAIAGASASNSGAGYALALYQIPNSIDYIRTQLFVAPDLDFDPIGFGTSVAISQDERWAYIGAPGGNKVYAYNRVDADVQSVAYTTGGATTAYNYANSILITAGAANPRQLAVTLNSTVLKLGFLPISTTGVTADGTNVVFNFLPTTPPALTAGILVQITGFTPAGYNGRYLVTSVTNNSITVANTFIGGIPTTYGQIQSEPYDYTVNGTNVLLNTVPPAGQQLRITRRTRVQLDQQVYVNVPYTYSGTGVGAEFTLDVVRGLYVVTIRELGVDYQVGDVITILGNKLIGGTTPGNNITFTVDTVDPESGAIETISSASIATPLPLTNNFSLAPDLYTATDLYSFTVFVNGQLYRPEIDYDFNSDSSIIDPDELVFSTIPPVGAEIVVAAETYWQYVDTITAPASVPVNAQFGLSLSTTTDGRQVMIGAPNDTVPNPAPPPAPATIAAGSTYVYDRSVVRYLVTDSSEDTYSIPGTAVDPITVRLNGQILANVDQVVDGQYSIVGSTVVLSATVVADLTIGDIVEIETNQFQQLQKLTANAPFDQSDFGTAVDVCPTNCSIYIGAPLDGTVLTQAGSVERRVNQSRVYGVTTSLIANPVLTAGNTIRINNVEVAVPFAPNNTVLGLADAISPQSYLNSKQYYTGDRVLYNSSVYVAIRSTLNNDPDGIKPTSVNANGTQVTFNFATQSTAPPVGATIQITGFTPAGYNGQYQIIASTFTSLTVANTTIESVVTLGQIQIYWSLSFPIPNVVATTTPDLTFIGDGVNKVFDIGNLYSAADSYTTVVYVNGVLKTVNVDYSYNNNPALPNYQKIVFTIAPAIASEILVVSGRMTVSVKNSQSATAFNKLTVAPGVITIGPNSVFDSLGFDTYAWTQTITSPNPTLYAQFGAAVNISDTAENLVVGAPRGDVIEPVIFDNGETYFDDRSTTFANPIPESGVVYTFDYLPSARDMITDPGKFAFGQQIFDSAEITNDGFGTAVNYVSGRLLIGSPKFNNVVRAGQFQIGLTYTIMSLGTIPNQTDFTDIGASSNAVGTTFIATGAGSGTGTASLANTGRVNIFTNQNNTPAWAVIYEQQPVVDVDLLNSVFMYDRLTSGDQTYFDFIDPLQGKILGAARRNIDYIGAVDPAEYNVGTVRNVGNSWAQEHVGEIWWDTDTVRFIDPNQDDITYASRRWGQVFPGSRVDVYQWISSSVLPINYTGPGVPLSLTSYTVSSLLDQQNIFETRYYFWVRGLTTIATGAGKTLSTTGIARYIESPRSSGIPYIAALNSSTVAIYNALNLLSAADTILHIEYDQEFTDAAVHQEYQLIADGRPDSFLNDILYRKLQDSFCGTDTRGAVVPDPFLSPPERFGVQFRPRQSMFVDRFKALQNYLERANTVLKQYAVTESRRFNLLNSSESEPNSIVGLGTVSISIASPAVITLNQGDLNLIQLPISTPVKFITSNQLPAGIEANTTYYIKSFLTIDSFTISEEIGGPAIATSGTQAGTQSIAQIVWDKRVATLEELSYQNINDVPIGYLYLVESDTSQQGKWTLYQVTAAGPVRELSLVRVQNFDTRKYWSYIDWYQPGYNSSIQPVAEVDNVTSLDTLGLSVAPVGSSVRVTANAQGKFEIYLRTDLGWDRVGLEDGTIEFSEVLWNYRLGGFGFDVEPFDTQLYGFDAEPSIETRKIIQAINQELFIDDLAIERNRSLMLMFNYIYSEFSAPEWLIKTSLVDVDHKIRALLPYQTYLQDNQDFVLEYIQEVKPYHVQIREFNLTYFGDDAYFGNLTDFDVPAYFDTSLVIPQYVSPVLTPYTLSGSSVESTTSDAAPDAEIWTQRPWSEWYNNYLLSIQNVIIIDGGAGYTVPPEVVVTGESAIPAQMTAIINSAGQVVAVDIVNPGAGYLTTATIEFVGGNGIGARAAAVMGGQGLGQNYNTTTIPTDPVAYGLSRSIKTTIKYDRYQYRTTIVDWRPDVPYENGTLVRYRNVVWEANSGDSSVVIGPVFDTAEWTRVNPATVSLQYNVLGNYYEITPGSTLISGVDRTMGFYVPGINSPGLSLPLLIDGVDYPGVQVYGLPYSPGNGYDQTPYDLLPFDVSGGLDLDAVYESSYLDLYLGTRPTDINVVGGGYVDVYSSYAPEELIPGSEFDTLDLRVYARAGSDWTTDGHGFPESVFKFDYDPANPTVEFANILPYPVQVLVANQTTGRDLTIGINYSINWVDQTVTMISGVTNNDVVVLSIYGLGGSNQLFKQMYVGTEVSNNITIPVNYDQIQELAIFVNGQPTVQYTFEPEWATPGVAVVYNPAGSDGTTLVVTSTLDIVVGSVINGTGFVSNQTVVAKINATTLIISAAPDSEPSGTLIFRANTGNTLVILDSDLTVTDRATLVALGPTVIGDTTVNYSWSAPVQQIITGQSGVLAYNLTNSMAFTNPVNAVVTVNGVRARTAACAEYISSDSTAFLLPTRLGFDPSLIADNQVLVYLNDIPQTLNIDYTVEPYDPNDTFREVILFQLPEAGTRILIAVTTQTQCQILNNQLIFNPVGGLVPITGDIISVISWNDTRQQNIETTVFVGPVQTNVTVVDPFDPLPRNDLLNGQPGSYDFAVFNDTQWSFDYSAGVPVFVNNLNLGRPITNPDRLWVTLNGFRLWYGEDFIVAGDEVILHSGILKVNDVVMITEFTESIVPEAMAFRIFQDMREIQATYRITVDTTTTLAEPLLPNQDSIRVTDASRLSDPNIVVDFGFVGDGSTETYTWDQSSISAIEIYIDEVLQLPSTYTLNAFKNSVTFDTPPEAGDVIRVRATVFVAFGVITIEGERIMYRTRNLTTNTVSSLLRGTAGTASGSIMEAEPVPLIHPVGAEVYDMGRGNLLPELYQNYIVSNLTNDTTVYPVLGNGINTIFVAESIDADVGDSTFDDESIEVYIGGTRQLSGYTITNLDPVTVVFDLAPFVGVEVTILVRRGVWWYATATAQERELPLQETNTPAARFLRGEI